MRPLAVSGGQRPLVMFGENLSAEPSLSGFINHGVKLRLLCFQPVPQGFVLWFLQHLMSFLEGVDRWDVVCIHRTAPVVVIGIGSVCPPQALDASQTKHQVEMTVCCRVTAAILNLWTE